MLEIENCPTVLSFFAHPDDETLAAGGFIKKLTSNGSDVHVAIPSTGIHSRRNKQGAENRNTKLSKLREDCQKAMNILGVPSKNLHLGEFSDNEMDKHTLLELVHWLEDLIGKVKPNLILTHHRFCTNIDHQYCHEAAVIATRPSTTNHISLLCGEIPSSTGYLKPTNWEPNYFVELSVADLNAKLESMEAFEEEARSDPHPRSREVLKALAKVRGSESGFFYSEAFMIQKSFG